MKNDYVFSKTLNLGLVYGTNGKRFTTNIVGSQESFNNLLVIIVQECNRFDIDPKYFEGMDIERTMSYFKKYYPKSVFRRIKKLKYRDLADINKEIISKRSKFLKELGT